MEPKRLIRRPPCPDYDVAGTESWLEDMAREGWLLGREGFFCGLAFFERAEPQEVTYRLAAALESTSMWGPNSGEPDWEEKELGARMGWEYLGHRGEFFVYRHVGEVERELHTDPAVQALAVKAVQRRQRGNLLLSLYWCIAFPLIRMRGAVFYLAVGMGLLLSLLWLTLLVSILGISLGRVLVYGRMKRQLERGEDLPHRTDWRRRQRGYRLGNAGWWALCLLTIALTLSTVAKLDESQPLADYGEDLPFAAMADLVGGEVQTYKPEGLGGLKVNRISTWSNALAPVNIDMNEHAAITRSDGTTFSGGLYVDYHQTCSPWLARRLAEDYDKKDSRAGYRSGDLRELDLPDLGIDSARAYFHIVPCVILQNGNKVIHAQFWQYVPEGEEIPLTDWAQRLADSIR